MISAGYTPEQYHHDTKRLTRWLCGRPWAGPDHAQDLAHDALLAALERQRRGLRPRAMGYLVKDAAKRSRLLPDRSRAEVEVVSADGQKRWIRRKTLIRTEVEQQIDLAVLMIPAAAPTDHLQDALELIHRVGSAQLRQAVQLVLKGANITEAAESVGMTPTSLRRALAMIGRKLTGRGQSTGILADTQQMDLFSSPHMAQEVEQCD